MSDKYVVSNGSDLPVEWISTARDYHHTVKRLDAEKQHGALTLEQAKELCKELDFQSSGVETHIIYKLVEVKDDN